MTNQEFNIAFKPFLDYFPTGEMTKEKSNIYYLALSHLTAEQLNKAFISMIRNRVYKNFPQVAEIIQYATHTTETELDDRVVLAKQMLKNSLIRYGSYNSVEFEDKGIHAVIDSLDGWQNLCSMSSDELEKFLTFEFAKIYKAYTRHNYPVTKSYIGYFDATNGTVNINKIGYRDMGKTLKLVTNKTQALKLQVSKNNFDIKEQQKNIQKLKDIIANA
jgi:hypothetical protein|nr:MAG TPA: hypothetical protein [Caudoviricetes sp.]